MSEAVQEKSVLEQMVEEQEKRNQEAEEAKQRKAAGGGFEFEEVEFFALKDKEARVCRILGNPAELRKKPTDAKFVLESKILSDDKKSYTKVNWPIRLIDGKLAPDPDWILTRLLNKIREGKWQKYEDNFVDTNGKKGQFVKFHSESSVYKRIESNSKPDEKYPPKFYPSTKVVMNVIDRHSDWCKEKKHSKVLTSRRTKYEFTNEEGKKGEMFFTDTGIPKQCYEVITDHFKRCSGIKSLSDIDAVIIRDGKSETSKYQCYDKTDYPKYFKDEAAFKITSDEPLSQEETNYELYDFDKLYPVASYNKLKKKLFGLFKLCDAELGTSFEKELTDLCKKELEANPNVQKNEEKLEKQEANEEKFASIGDDKPIETPKQEKSKRSKAEEVLTIAELCKKNFPAWDKLSDDHKKIMMDSIISFKGTIPIYKEGVKELLCPETEKDCMFVDTKELTAYPETVNICPVCGCKS